MLEEKQNIGYYAIIPAAVLYNNELKPNQKILYAVITSLSNKEGYCYASNKRSYQANYEQREYSKEFLENLYVN